MINSKWSSLAPIIGGAVGFGISAVLAAALQLNDVGGVELHTHSLNALSNWVIRTPYLIAAESLAVSSLVLLLVSAWFFYGAFACLAHAPRMVFLVVCIAAAVLALLLGTHVINPVDAIVYKVRMDSGVNDIVQVCHAWLLGGLYMAATWGLVTLGAIVGRTRPVQTPIALHLRQQRRDLRLILYLGAFTLAAGVFYIEMLDAMPAAFLEYNSDAVRELARAAAWREGVRGTLLLLCAYGIGDAILRLRGDVIVLESSDEDSKELPATTLLQELSAVFAVVSPVLTAAMGTFAKFP